MAIINPIPQTLTAFNLFIDGYSLGGKVKSLSLPSISFKKESYQPGGISGDINFHHGLEAMEFSSVIADYDPGVISKAGFKVGRKVSVIARAATTNKDGIKVPYSARLKGNISSLDFGSWEMGSSHELSFSMDIDYFRVDISEQKTIEIDLLNMIQFIGGEDQLEVDRAMILRTVTPTG